MSLKKFMKGVVCAALLFVVSVSTYADSAYTINGVTVQCSDFWSSPGECWNYANNMYRKIWGSNFTSDFGTDDNLLKNLSDEELTLTEDHLRDYISQAEVGATFRVSSSSYLHSSGDWSGHSHILAEIDDDGFTVLEGGMNDWPYYREKHYTWNEFVNTGWLAKYGYIKYIKWPGATPIE